MEKELPVRKLRSKFYKKIIEVRVPVRFYWTEDGFDGIDVGPLDERYTKHCRRLLMDILETIELHSKPETSDVSNVCTKAFE